MKRVMAMILFAAGGFATEVVHPVYCSLLAPSMQSAARERKREQNTDSRK
ncbi:hypothetical protein [Paraburkholderia kururiensis]|nr:hypothetical protein [Paraburkholderia kururiensis]